MSNRLVKTALVASCLSARAMAQPEGPQDVPSVGLVRTEVAPVIDGRLDDLVWADATLIAHFGFILFIVAGGLIGRRSNRLAAVHLLALGYGVTIATLGFRCPLTPLEQSFRRAAGDAGYEGGFVEHYLLDIIYPGGIDSTVRVAMVLGLLAVLLVSYGSLAQRSSARWRSRAHDRRAGTSAF